MIIDKNAYKPYKDTENGKVWWSFDGTPGSGMFSFDKIHWFSYPEDYCELTPEQKAIFDTENPKYAEFLNNNGWG